MIEYTKQTDEGLHNLYDFAGPIWRECYNGVIPEGQIELLVHKYFDYDNIVEFQKNGMIYENIMFNGAKAGLLAYEIHDEYIYLDKLYLKSEYRGNHISTKSFDYLIKTYNKPIRLNVNQGNKLGMRAYEGNGFKVIEEKRYDLPNGYVNYDYIMEKPV